jgi:hypothetical protein
VGNPPVAGPGVYTRKGKLWTQQGGKLVGTGARGNAFQGVFVALSGDGNTGIVGGPGGFSALVIPNVRRQTCFRSQAPRCHFTH